MRLYIDSGTHSFTNTDARISKIEENIDSPGVVFTEESTKSATLSDAIKLLPTAPLTMAAMIFYSKIGLPIVRKIWGDDRDIEDHIVEKHTADRVPTDKSTLKFIRNISQLHFASNWLVICVALIFWLQFGTPILTLLTLPGVSAVALFLTFLAGIHESRNAHIAQEIARHKDECDKACLVTGREHHESVGTLLKWYEGIEVLNPTPKDA